MRKAVVWGASLGFAFAMLAPASPAAAASRHARTHHTKVSYHHRHHSSRFSSPTDPRKDAALIIDGRTGAVLYARNDDAQRYPASLTKMMTLYLLFDALKQGKVTMDTPLKVSAHGAAQSPTKLYLKPGETIPVETAIKAIVVLSANDVAVTIAENLGGTEKNFARLMTEKAHQLGMKNTHYDNASGLPDRGQITTADDLALLARHVAYDFPQYFHYFSTVSFSWHGRQHITHNNLIGNYEGADGMKTGFTNASGFNLVASVVRNGEHVIGVVMGGYTARSRDREMEHLLDRAFARAKTNPNLLSRAEVPWQRLADNDTGTGAVARNGRAGMSVATPTPMAKPKPIQIADNYPQTLVSAGSDSDNVGQGDVPDDTRSTAAAIGARAWAIQIGAFSSAPIAKARLSIYEHKSADLLKTAQQLVIPVESAEGHTMYRARFGPMAERDAREICAHLTERGQTCFATMSAQ